MSNLDAKLIMLLVLPLAGGCPSDEDPQDETGATATATDTEGNGPSSTGADDPTVTTTADASSSSSDGATDTASTITTTDDTTSSGGSSESGSGGESSSSTGGSTENVVWADLEITEGCFLFVDPDILGNSASWTEEGGQVSLVFDALDTVTYEGMPEGTGLTLFNQMSEDFAGETWVFTQEFVGTVDDGHFTGTWSYVECNETVLPDSCPDGGCTGTATFDITIP